MYTSFLGTICMELMAVQPDFRPTPLWPETLQLCVLCGPPETRSQNLADQSLVHSGRCEAADEQRCGWQGVQRQPAISPWLCTFGSQQGLTACPPLSPGSVLSAFLRGLGKVLSYLPASSVPQRPAAAQPRLVLSVRGGGDDLCSVEPFAEESISAPHPIRESRLDETTAQTPC